MVDLSVVDLAVVDLAAVLADVNGLGAPFLVAWAGDPQSGDPQSGDPADTAWFAAAGLTDPGSGELRRMVELHARSRGMDVGRHVASLAFQRYCHRICAVSVAAWLRHGLCLELSASNTAVRFRAGTPDLIALGELAAAPDAEPATLLEVVLDGHLLPMAAALSAGTGPGMGNLWGNIAAGFAGAFRNLSRQPGAIGLGDVRERAEALLGARPQLQRGGDFRILEGAGGPRLEYDRKSCCHWYAAPDGKYCSWCSRLSFDERTCRFRESMAAG